MPFDPDGAKNLIDFKVAVPLLGKTGSLSVDVFGSSVAIARVQVGIFDSADAVLVGIGFDPFPPPLTTENGGRASWLFNVPAQAAYMKWSISAARIATGQDSYSVTAKVRNADGDALATSQFSALFPSDKLADETYFDGVDFQQPLAAIPPKAAARATR